MSMAAHAARRLEKMNQNLSAILGIEAIAAAQGIAFRAPLQTSQPLRQVLGRIRASVPALDADRYLAPDLRVAADLVRTGHLVEGLDLPPLTVAAP